MIKKAIIILIFLIIGSADAQIIYTPPSSGVYDFLERAASKNIINLNDEVKPYSRKYISEKLKEITSFKDKLNSVEKDELEFYMKEFAYELKHDKERWFLYGYSDSLFRIRVSPIAGYGISASGSNSGHTRWPGVYVYGSYSKSFGASFQYQDVGEFGNNVDRNKQYTPLTGHFYKTASNGIEFSDVRGSMTYDFQWGSVSIIKDYTVWGHGRYGNLILSNKAASFPQLQLRFNPVPWMRFSYIHGWLNSQVLDSSSFYYNNTQSREPFLRRDYINKYFVGNLLTVTPLSWFDFSLGNSFIYSGNLRPEMFIPFMYYKVMDHNTGRGDIDDGNGQIFFDLSVRYPQTFQFYSTLLIDVLEIKEILKGDWYTSWFGYTLGFRKTDLLFDNLSMSLEYSKTNPWVYENKDETSNYKHLNYPLGHWIGQNADHLRLQFDYIPFRGLRLAFYGERLRKGGMNDIVEAYKYRMDLPFLYGNLRKDFRFGLTGSFEIMHDLFVKGQYEYSDINDEDKSRTPEFILGMKNNFYLLVNYGL